STSVSSSTQRPTAGRKRRGKAPPRLFRRPCPRRARGTAGNFGPGVESNSEIREPIPTPDPFTFHPAKSAKRGIVEPHAPALDAAPDLVVGVEKNLAVDIDRIDREHVSR